MVFYIIAAAEKEISGDGPNSAIKYKNEEEVIRKIKQTKSFTERNGSELHNIKASNYLNNFTLGRQNNVQDRLIRLIDAIKRSSSQTGRLT